MKMDISKTFANCLKMDISKTLRTASPQWRVRLAIARSDSTTGRCAAARHSAKQSRNHAQAEIKFKLVSMSDGFTKSGFRYGDSRMKLQTRSRLTSAWCIWILVTARRKNMTSGSRKR